MAQNYDPNLPEDGVTTFGQLYEVLRNKFESLRTCFSGTSFPVSAVAGQLCWRTDRNRLYVFTENTNIGEGGWVEVQAEISQVIQEVINARGSKSSLDQRLDVSLNEDGTLKSNVNAYQSEWIKPNLSVTYVDATTFKIEGDQTDIFTAYRRVKLNHNTNTTFSHVVSSSYSDTDNKTTVTIADNVISSDLNSVEYGIIHSDRTRDSLPRNVDADKLDGYDAGHNSGQIPIADGTLCTNLNADKLDGYDASTTPASNVIPVTNSDSEIPKDFVPFFQGFKNHIINGDFAVWQRGTSFNSTGYTADRWRYDSDTDDTITVSRSSTDGTEPFTAQYYATLGLTAGSSGTYNKFSTRLEFPKLYFGKTYTLSFYARASTSTTITAKIAFVFSDTEYEPTSQTVNIGTSWQRHSVTFNLGTPTGFTESEADYLDVAFLLPINVTVVIDFANIQLEKGSEMTNFENVPYDIQVIRCMRYYEKSYLIDTQPGTATGNACAKIHNEDTWISGGWRVYLHYTMFKVLKRALPTITLYSKQTGAEGKIYCSSNSTDYTASADDINTIGFMAVQNNSGDNIPTGNIMFHWVADAEL